MTGRVILQSCRETSSTFQAATDTGVAGSLTFFFHFVNKQLRGKETSTAAWKTSTTTWKTSAAPRKAAPSAWKAAPAKIGISLDSFVCEYKVRTTQDLVRFQESSYWYLSILIPVSVDRFLNSERIQISLCEILLLYV